MTRTTGICSSVLWLVLVDFAASRSIGDIIASELGLSNSTAIMTGSSPSANASSKSSNTSAITTGSFSNTSTDSCWPSWTEYWSYTQAIANPRTSDVSMIFSTVSGYEPGNAASTETDLLTFSGTSIQYNGGFTISTRTMDSVATQLFTLSAESPSSYTVTWTYTSITLLPYEGPSVPMPTCQLSSIVPQCQSQWEAYASSELLPSPTRPAHCDINKGLIDTQPRIETQPPCASVYWASVSLWYEQVSVVTKPPCTQASVGGQLCSTIKDAYVHQQNDVFFPNISFAPYFSNGYLGSFADIKALNYSRVWWWPTSSTLGVPGCTLGCGRCAVTGNTVKLLYWPDATQSEAGTDPITISTLGTVLTSPTYYVSYRSVFASDGCSGVGPTIYNTIVPIPGAEQLSSVFGGTIPCDDAHGANGFTQEWTATASFNVTDLNEPVPFSIYSSQPWCATYQYEHGCNTQCPTTDAYKPLIVVPEVVLQNMNSEWASCYGDIRGVYDPPIALTQVASLKAPQMTDSFPATSESVKATPASAPSQPATETGVTIGLPDNLLPDNQPLENIGDSGSQASQLSEPSHGVGGVGVATVLPDNLPSDSADGDGPQVSHPFEASQYLGGVAAILGGSGNLNGAEGSSPDRGSEISGGNGLPDNSPSNNADGSILPQGSQPSESSQHVGELVAAILGSAGSNLGSASGDSSPQGSQSSRSSQDAAGLVAAILGGAGSDSDVTDGDSLPQDSEPSESSQDVGGLVAALFGSAGRSKEDEGRATATLGSSPIAGGVHDASISAGSLSKLPPTTPDNESGVIKPLSTQGSVVGAQGGTDGSNPTAGSALTGMTPFIGGSGRSLCSRTLMVAISSLIVLHML